MNIDALAHAWRDVLEEGGRHDCASAWPALLRAVEGVGNLALADRHTDWPGSDGLLVGDCTVNARELEIVAMAFLPRGGCPWVLRARRAADGAITGARVRAGEVDPTFDGTLGRAFADAVRLIDAGTWRFEATWGEPPLARRGAEDPSERRAVAALRAALASGDEADWEALYLTLERALFPSMLAGDPKWTHTLDGFRLEPVETDGRRVSFVGVAWLLSPDGAALFAAELELAENVDAFERVRLRVGVGDAWDRVRVDGPGKKASFRIARDGADSVAWRFDVRLR